MNPKGQEIADAIRREVEENWPGVTLTISEGGKHPKAKFAFGEESLFIPFSGTAGSRHAVVKALSDARRTMRQLGAERTKPDPTPEEDEAVYRKPPPKGPGLADMVKHERAAPKPDIADQLIDAGLATERSQPEPAQTALALAPARAREIIIDQPELEPLGPGEHFIDAERYHSDPCERPSLSASIAKTAIEYSLYHAWFGHPRLNQAHEEKDANQFRVGRAFHTMLLGCGAPIEVFDYKDWRKDAAKADKEDSLRRGCTPLLPDQFKEIEAMTHAARAQMRRREDLAYAMAGGRPERVFIWEEETPSGPILCRMMADWTPHAGRYGVDWKTTGVGAGPDAWGSRTMWDMGCDIQDAFYRRGWRKTIGLEIDALIFAVVESKEPHALMHHRVMPSTQAGADMEVQWAINAWGACLKHGRWPGYPLDMAWQEKPGWRSDRQQAKWDNGQRDTSILDAQLAALAEIAAMPHREGAVPQTDDNPFGLAPIEGDD